MRNFMGPNIIGVVTSRRRDGWVAEVLVDEIVNGKPGVFRRVAEPTEAAVLKHAASESGFDPRRLKKVRGVQYVNIYCLRSLSQMRGSRRG